MDEIDDQVSWAAKFMGGGSWLLKGCMEPAFAGLKSQIESLWRMLVDDLGLYEIDRKYKLLDSMDPDRKHGRWGFLEMEDPKRGDPNWPRMQIENRCYCSPVFRKLHLEFAYRQDGLQVLHCVMYPRIEYDLPILSFDMVGKHGRVSLVCIDPCPVSLNRTLPVPYITLVRELQSRFDLENNRVIPEWGKEIFSEYCIIMRPTEQVQLSNFIKYTISLTHSHLQIAQQCSKVSTNKEKRVAEIREAHLRYARQHLKNSSTRGVLAAAFTDQIAEAYMRNVMFDEDIDEVTDEDIDEDYNDVDDDDDDDDDDEDPQEPKDQVVENTHNKKTN